MRAVALLLLTLTTCRAQTDESSVAAVLQQMERAEQTGDFNTWVGLWTREKSAEAETLRPYAKARPEVRYRATTTFVRGDLAVLLVECPSQSFLTMTLHREDGQWKIQDQFWRDTPADPRSVYAIVPPDQGAFARSGSRWDLVAPAMNPGDATRLGWQMKAVFDESYLYIRIEFGDELPAPGSTIVNPPSGWPVLKIGVSGAGEFVLHDEVDVGDQATFDEHGKANSHRAYAAYAVRLERNGHEVFSTWADTHPSPLVEVAGRDYDIRIPLATMGITNSPATRITIGDAQWPKSAVLSFAALRYSR